MIVISKPSFFKGEAQLINELFDLGMQRFHLRKEASDRRAHEVLLREINPCYLERIALHQFHELAVDFDLHRLHFKEKERLEGRHGDFTMKPEITLSTSIHSTTHLTDLHNFKYTFFGPVFQSISKKDYPGMIPAGFNLHQIADPKKPQQEVKNLPPSMTKVIALGGVTASKISQLQQMNFDGAAVLGALWNAPEQAIPNFKKIKQACQTTA
nr:thiamine phosphate synthase [Pedobacter polysacchareus]